MGKRVEGWGEGGRRDMKWERVDNKEKKSILHILVNIILK